MVLALAVLGVPQATGFVQPAAAQEYVFNAIVVEGNERIEPATVLSYAAIPRGQPITAGALSEAYRRLVDSGLFAEVEMKPQGSRLVIAVRENPIINRISFEGNRRLKDEDLEKIIESKSRRVYSPAKAEADAQRIADAYRQQGRIAATVTPKVIRVEGNRVDLVFEIAEGNIIEIERVSFVGNRHFSDWRLRRVIGSKQAGLFRRLIRSDTFIEDRIAFDRQVLTDFYNSRGFVDFKVLSVTPELTRNRDAFYLTFRVQEGQQFRFGKIDVTSSLPGVDPDEFRKVVKIRPGRVYSPVLVDQAIRRLERLATQKGLTFVRADPHIRRNDADQTLDVEFQLVRGPRIFVERIDIEGNTATLDKVIRRHFRLVEGDPFNPREIRDAAERIRALGFFSNVDVSTREGSSPDKVIVDVNVEEQPTGTLSFGLSYGVQTGPAVALSFSETNFLGRGQTVRLSLDTGTDNRNLGFTFIEPYLLDRDLKLGLSAWYQTTTQQDEAYDTELAGFSPSLEFPVSENGRLNLAYKIARDRISNVSPASSPILLAEAGTKWTSSVSYTYSYDTRITGIDPNAGLLLRFGQEFAGLGGDTKFIRTTALVAAERKVLQENVTLRAAIEGGAITSLGNTTTRVTDRFFLTSQRMRGFERNGVGPRDLTVANLDALGGNYFAVTRLEAEFPLGLPVEYGMTGGVFLDIGSVWGLDNTNGGAVDDSMHLRSAIGFSIFWDTQIGPLRFNFSKAIKKESYDREQRFDLTISTRF